jgi:hypothetical protein
MTSCAMSVIVLLIMVAIIIAVSKRYMPHIIAPYGRSSQNNWWERADWYRFGYPTYSYWENFENPGMHIKDSSALLSDKEGTVLEYPPNAPSPVELYNNQPYHLLEDVMSPPRVKESISCVNSRSCYATDFDRMISKTGNFRQMTNNYKRGYPDSCSAPYQELVLNFYKADPMTIPKNNTGGSVSEAAYGK